MAEVWKYINKRRGIKKEEENNITKECWEVYFKNLLEGAAQTNEEEGESNKNIRNNVGKTSNKEKSGLEEKSEDKLGVKKIDKAIWKIKKKKQQTMMKYQWKHGNMKENM